MPGEPNDDQPVEPGYATVEREFSVGDVIVLDLPVVPRWTWPDPRVDAIRGQVAVERGPVVLCIESVDLGDDVNAVRVHTDTPPQEQDGRVLVRISTTEFTTTPWPYGTEPAAGGVRAVGVHDTLVPLVPCNRWANRGPSTMRVWMPTAD